jgi:SAM-dependent methyltransferase
MPLGVSVRLALATLTLFLAAAYADAQVFRRGRTWSGCGNAACAMCYPPQQTPYYLAPKYTKPQTLVQAAEPYVELKFAPSPTEVIETALAIARPRRGEIFYDIGCGDGRVLIHAATKYNVGALGIELDPQIAELARERVNAANCGRSVTVVIGDAVKYSLDKADIIYLYQTPQVIAKLKPMRARCVVSYMHDVPQLDMQRVEWTDKAGRTQLLYVSQ